jgi:hypothetical protein
MKPFRAFTMLVLCSLLSLGDVQSMPEKSEEFQAVFLDFDETDSFTLIQVAPPRTYDPRLGNQPQGLLGPSRRYRMFQRYPLIEGMRLYPPRPDEYLILPPNRFGPPTTNIDINVEVDQNIIYLDRS